MNFSSICSFVLFLRCEALDRHSYIYVSSLYSFRRVFVSRPVMRLPRDSDETMFEIPFTLRDEYGNVERRVSIDAHLDGERETVSSPRHLLYNTLLSICSLTPPPRSNIRLFSVIFLIIIATILFL